MSVLPFVKSAEALEVEPTQSNLIPAQRVRTSQSWSARVLDQLAALNVIHPHMRQGEIFNAFIALRNHLEERELSKRNVIAVMAVEPHAGAGFVAMNLAASFAMGGQRSVMLVQADFHAPHDPHPLYPRRSVGLSDLLAEDTFKVNDAVYSTPIPGFSVVPDGFLTQAPVAFFSGARADHVFTGLRRFRDAQAVVVNAPCSAAVDAPALIRHCDHIVLVARRAQTPKHKLAQLAQSLPENKLAGVVFNDELTPPFAHA